MRLARLAQTCRQCQVKVRQLLLATLPYVALSLVQAPDGLVASPLECEETAVFKRLRFVQWRITQEG